MILVKMLYSSKNDSKLKDKTLHILVGSKWMEMNEKGHNNNVILVAIVFFISVGDQM